MKTKIIFSLLIAIGLLIIISCSEDENPTNPAGEDNILVNSTFEKNGAPYEDGWKISPPPRGEIVEDAPSGGGDYSLQLAAFDPEGGSATITVAAMEDKMIYKLSLWAKTNSPSSVIFFDQIRNGVVVSREEVDVSDSSWKEIFLTDTLNIAAGDSLRITFMERLSQLVQLKTNYDLCKLAAVE